MSFNSRSGQERQAFNSWKRRKLARFWHRTALSLSLPLLRLSRPRAKPRILSIDRKLMIVSDRGNSGRGRGEGENQKRQRKRFRFFFFCRRLGSCRVVVQRPLFPFLELSFFFLTSSFPPPLFSFSQITTTGDQHPPCRSGGSGLELEGRARQGRRGRGCRCGSQAGGGDDGRGGGDGSFSGPGSCLEENLSRSEFPNAHFPE